MSKEREKIKVDEKFIWDVVYNNLVDFKLIEDKAETDDADDGNEHNFVIQRISDGKFFSGNYNWWDGPDEFDDFSDELEEVFPKQVMVTIYE